MSLRPQGRRILRAQQPAKAITSLTFISPSQTESPHDDEKEVSSPSPSRPIVLLNQLRTPGRPIIISITGAIGSGKSTYIKALQARYSRLTGRGFFHMISFEEPVESWKNDKGQNWLKLFYADKAKWALAFQLRILRGQIEMMEGIGTMSESPMVILTERAPMDGAHIFCEQMVKDGLISDKEQELFMFYSERAWKPDGIVWIRASSSTCMERIGTRGRNFERPDDGAYFTHIARRYDDLMGGKNWGENMIAIDNDQADPRCIEDGCATIESWISTIVSRVV